MNNLKDQILDVNANILMFNTYEVIRLINS